MADRCRICGGRIRTERKVPGPNGRAFEIVWRHVEAADDEHGSAQPEASGFCSPEAAERAWREEKITSSE